MKINLSKYDDVPKSYNISLINQLWVVWPLYITPSYYLIDRYKLIANRFEQSMKSVKPNLS